MTNGVSSISQVAQTYQTQQQNLQTHKNSQNDQGPQDTVVLSKKASESTQSQSGDTDQDGDNQ